MLLTINLGKWPGSAISSADFHESFRVFINRFCRVIDRRITSSISDMKRRNNKLEHCFRSLTVLIRSTTKCTTKPVDKKLDRLAIEGLKRRHSRRLSVLLSSKSHLSLVNTEEHTISLSPLPSGLVSEHEQIGGQIIRMRYRMSVSYGHPVIAATRALRFANHVTKRNGGSGDENDRRTRTFSVLSTRTSKNVSLRTLCACSVRKTRTGTRPRPPI